MSTGRRVRPQPADGAISGHPDLLFLDEPTVGLRRRIAPLEILTNDAQPGFDDTAHGRVVLL